MCYLVCSANVEAQCNRRHKKHKICIKYYFKLEITASKNYGTPNKTVQDDITRRKQTFQRYLIFKYSLASVEDFEVLGHQSSSQDEQYVQNLCQDSHEGRNRVINDVICCWTFHKFGADAF